MYKNNLATTNVNGEVLCTKQVPKRAAVGAQGRATMPTAGTCHNSNNLWGCDFSRHAELGYGIATGNSADVQSPQNRVELWRKDLTEDGQPLRGTLLQPVRVCAVFFAIELREFLLWRPSIVGWSTGWGLKLLFPRGLRRENGIRVGHAAPPSWLGSETSQSAERESVPR